MTPVISLKDVSVHFPIYGMGSRSIKKNLMALATGGLIMQSGASNVVVVEALRNATLDIHEGDRVALVGHNGAGKSTLLRVASGIYEPTLGEVEVRGKISSLFDISLGTDAEATGYENIRTSGLLRGMSAAEIAERTPEIAEFSGLGDYLKMPLRTYSAGMMVRLAFSIATSAQPEVLAMDEWIAVGDKDFTQKASQRLKEMVGGAKVLLLASHSAHLLREVCNKALLLEHGRVLDFGDAKNIIDRYMG